MLGGRPKNRHPIENFWSHKKLLNREFGLRSFFAAAYFALFGFFAAFPAQADYVGEVQTTKYLDSQTINMISSRLQAGQAGIQVGDEISYFIQFTPTDNGGIIGAGGYVTDYIPAGTQVVNAQFVQLNGDGTFSQIAPPSPAEVMAAYVPGVSDTGIFFSTDPRTAKYTNPASTSISSINGYPAMGGMTTHNLWDSQMVVAYSAAARIATVGCPLVSPWVAAMGAGPVAGRDTILKTDYSGGTGPWQRISYPGSYYGTMTGTVGVYGGCVGGVPTTAGWALSSFNPLPANTNAVRFAAGRVTVGELFSVRITLKVTDPIPISGLINNTEVFGGDTSIKAPGTLVGKDVVWKYHIPNVANADTTLTVIKRVVGMCAGVGCVPQPFSGGAVPSLANLKLRYEITYLNSSGGPQTAVTLSDILPAGFTLVAGSEVVVTGPNILPTAPVVGGFSFKTIGTLGSGSGGTVRFDISTVAAPAVKTVISNTAKLVSLSLPGGMQSVATVSPTNTASVTMNVTTSTPTSTPSGSASYTASLANNGAAGATLGPLATDGGIVFTLPSSGGTLPTERFTFKQPAVGAMCGATALAANQACGVLTTPGVGAAPATTSYVVLAVTGGGVATALAPYTGLNREQLTLRPTVLTTIPIGGKLDVSFGATVGTNVASSTVGYTSDAVVTYGGGFVTAPGLTTISTSGVAPIKVDIPLSITVAIDCVYSGLICQPYTSGSIPSNSKIRYRLDYINTGAAQNNVILTNTLPASTSFVAASASTSPQPSQLGQVLTFPTIASLGTGATGSVTFDVQLPLAAVIPSGSYITNSANIKSDGYLGGASGSLTTTVNDSANLTIAQTTTTPTLVKCTAVNVPVGCGQASYRITVTNNGFSPASGIIVNELLPFAGTVINAAATRFNFTAGSSVIAGMTSVLPTVLTTAPTMPGYTTNLNQQQVIWNFGAQTLAAGASFTIDFKADAGTSLAAGPTVYKSNAIANYNSGVTALVAADLNTASVSIPSNLSIATTIDCVYNAAGTVCDKYTNSGIIPVGAKVRYKMHYQNTASMPQANVYLCNQIISTQVAPVFTATITQPTLPPIPAAAFADVPVIGAPAQIVAASATATACGYSGAGTFAYPVIASLAAGASGDVYYDLTTSAAATATVTNTGKMTNASGTETSAVSVYAQNVPVLQITKAVTPSARFTGETATYTITIKNTGNLATTSLKVFDFLPYSGTTADATKRFNYLATTGYTGGLPVPAVIAPETVNIPTNIPPNQTGYSGNTNQQQVKWDFGAYALAPGATVSITFTAQVGTAMPAGTYVNNVRAEFTSAAGSGNPTISDTTDQVSVSSPTSFADIVITKSNGVNGVLPGSTTQYTITVANNGPDTASGIKIIDPAVAGLSKSNVSCSSPGLSCPLIPTIADLEGAGIVLTPFGSGATATITVDANVTALSGSVTNTVNAILPSGVGDPVGATPTTATDTDSVLISDISTSTITWVDSNGGSHDPGDVITFTVTLIESGGIAATAVNLTDTILAGLTNLTVTGLGGGTDNSTATFVDIRNITVPANGRVTLIFTATIAAGTATGTAINNTATALNPTGTPGTLTAATIVVGTPTATGSKALYLYGSDAATGLVACSAAVPCKMSRATTPLIVPSNSVVSIPRNTAAPFTWNLSPALQLPVTLDPALLPPVVAPALPSIPVTLNLAGMRAGARNYTVLVELYCSNAVPIAPAAISQQLVVNMTGGAAPTPVAFALPLAGVTNCPATFNWVLRITNIGNAAAGRDIIITPSIAAVAPATTPTYSNISLPSQNVINVDSVTAYSAAYPTVTTATNYASGSTVYLRAVVSDPFGSFDITSAKLGITDSVAVSKLTAGALLTGTLAVTNASATVTGTGTQFTTELVVGDVLALPNGCYTVSAIASATSLTLGAAYTGTAASGLKIGRKANGFMCPVADSGLATKTFEYAYTIPTGSAGGIWDATVTANEGTEGAVTHTRAGGFAVQLPVDHYEISVASNSIACVPTTVWVRACQNTSNPCDTFATSINSSVTLSANDSVTSATVGSLTNATFNLASGVGSSSLSYPAAADNTAVVLSLSAVTDAATNTPTCQGSPGSSAGCTTTFNTAGFIVSATNAVDAPAVTIPNYVAGKTSATYYLRAIKTGSATRACETLLNSATTVGVGYECTNPAACTAADLLSVNGGTSTVVGRDDTVGVTSVSMNFAATNNAAPFTFKHSDVGNIRLHFQKTGVGGTTLNGSSNSFRVDPYGFSVVACTTLVGGKCSTANASPVDGTGAMFVAAGDVFNATVTAITCNEQADGSCLPGTRTPNYGAADSANAAIETVILSRSLVAPSGGADGTLRGTGSAVVALLNPTPTALYRSSFTDGSKTLFDLTWDEVGVMALTANASGFMGDAAVNTSGTSGNIGRFVPHHFDTVATGTLGCASSFASCPAGNMVYSGQRFAGATVTARNAAGTTTANYKYVDATVSFAKPITLTAVVSSGGGPIGSGALSAPAIVASKFTTASPTVTGVDAPSFALSTLDPLDVFLHATDGEASSGSVGSTEGGLKVVSGRVKIGNAYGSELVPLTVPVNVQYYDGALWRNSTTDNTTQIDTTLGNNVVRSGSLTGLNTVSGGVKTVQSGVLRNFQLAGPGVKGKATLSAASVGGDLDFLLPNSVSGEVTFGIYAAKQPFIYLRESY
jgi:MSHA biogenesis protein MshQ